MATIATTRRVTAPTVMRTAWVSMLERKVFITISTTPTSHQIRKQTRNVERTSNDVCREKQTGHRSSELRPQRATDHVICTSSSHLSIGTKSTQRHGSEERHGFSHNKHSIYHRKPERATERLLANQSLQLHAESGGKTKCPSCGEGKVQPLR